MKAGGANSSMCVMKKRKKTFLNSSLLDNSLLLHLNLPDVESKLSNTEPKLINNYQKILVVKNFQELEVALMY